MDSTSFFSAREAKYCTFLSGENIVEVKLGSCIIGYKEQDQEQWRRRGKPQRCFARLRLRSIEKLIKGRHGWKGCDTDDGEVYFDEALPLILEIARSGDLDLQKPSEDWARRWTPRLLAEHDGEWFRERESRAPKKRRVSADQLARALGVRSDEVQRFELKTFGSTDKPKEVRLKERKAANAAYQREKRRKNGATPRAECLARTKPWEAEGISKRTYYRRLHKALVEAGDRDSSASELVLLAA